MKIEINLWLNYLGMIKEWDPDAIITLAICDESRTFSIIVNKKYVVTETSDIVNQFTECMAKNLGCGVSLVPLQPEIWERYLRSNWLTSNIHIDELLAMAKSIKDNDDEAMLEMSVGSEYEFRAQSRLIIKWIGKIVITDYQAEYKSKMSTTQPT